MFAKLNQVMILITKIGRYPERMSPVTYIRTLLMMIGIQYAGAVVFAAVDFFAPAVILVATATLAITHIMSIMRNG